MTHDAQAMKSGPQRKPGPKQARINELERALYRASDKAQRYRDALQKIRDYPKGWGDNPSVCDFIDEVLR